jgi:hypothetical protein
MFKLWFSNVDSGAREFLTLDEALAYGKKAGFEFVIYQEFAGGGLYRVGKWSVFGGWQEERDSAVFIGKQNT